MAALTHVTNFQISTNSKHGAISGARCLSALENFQIVSRRDAKEMIVEERY